MDSLDPVPSTALPNALSSIDELCSRLGPEPAVFLDYDGTLCPIVENPAMAILDESMREAIAILHSRVPVAVVSGRDLPDVAKRVALADLHYAGSHGFDISGPETTYVHPAGLEGLPSLDRAEAQLRELLGSVQGVLLERKRFAVTVHFRRAAPSSLDAIKAHFVEVARGLPSLTTLSGKCVLELRPNVDWNKGRAVEWLTRTLAPGSHALYLGDDVTDEDAFVAVRSSGVGVLVDEQSRPTLAHYRLQNVPEVEQFLRALADRYKA